jgi:hypothetical protein
MDLGLTCRCGGKSKQEDLLWRCNKCRYVLARQTTVGDLFRESATGPMDPDFNVVTTHPQPSGVQ